MPCNRLLRSAKRVAKAKTENGKEGCVAEVVVIMRNELGQTLLKAGVLDRADNRRIVFPFDAVHVDFMLTKAA